MDCVSFGDKCRALGVKAFPTFALYQKGVLIDTFTGKKSMEGLSEFVEGKLDSIRPGSRPQNGLKLPEPGATSVDTTPQTDNSEPDNNPQPLASQSVFGKNPKETSKTNKASPSNKTPVVPNPKGTSIPLTAESFQKLVTTAGGGPS